MNTDGARRTLLAVHDEHETRRVIKETLVEQGYDVTAAEDASSALEAARRTRPDLILMALGKSPLDVIGEAVELRTSAGLGEAVPVIIFPAVRSEVEALDLPVGHNIYLTFLHSIEHLNTLISRLLTEETVSPFPPPRPSGRAGMSGG